jgi:hypothetical protein
VLSYQEVGLDNYPRALVPGLPGITTLQEPLLSKEAMSMAEPYIFFQTELPSLGRSVADAPSTMDLPVLCRKPLDGDNLVRFIRRRHFPELMNEHSALDAPDRNRLTFCDYFLNVQLHLECLVQFLPQKDSVVKATEAVNTLKERVAGKKMPDRFHIALVKGVHVL